jgi:hypothetical protein
MKSAMRQKRSCVQWSFAFRVGFVATNLAGAAEHVVAFYSKRGGCEQWIKKEKGDQPDAAVMPILRAAALGVQGVERSRVMSSGKATGKLRPDDRRSRYFPCQNDGSSWSSAILRSGCALRDGAR